MAHTTCERCGKLTADGIHTCTPINKAQQALDDWKNQRTCYERGTWAWGYEETIRAALQLLAGQPSDAMIEAAGRQIYHDQTAYHLRDDYRWIDLSEKQKIIYINQAKSILTAAFKGMS